MAREIIPWHIFFESMAKQRQARLGAWLAKWYFGDDGAVLHPFIGNPWEQLGVSKSKVLGLVR